ncbi:anti-sigma factor domain-containing protein [Galbibacter sp.]|uniref:anti-sigma factor domain-containing protein n=1 Tax=Galbibacter sp. TaxID=2918471 RepID=UPI002C812285|nr:anti-sigma factor [Galbibacter sp.]HLV63679.1 anti-sigma factor [Galbibacter sp.]
MKNEVKLLLESDLLERYLLGNVSYEEQVQVEHFIDTSKEVKSAYNTLEKNLELYSKAFALKAPETVLDNVLESIKKDTHTEDSSKRSIPWYFVAACVTTLLFGATTITLWNQNRLLSTTNNSVAGQIENLKADIINTNARLENMKSKYAVLSDPETQKYLINGNERAKNLRTVAYINPKERLSAINVLSVPDLPKDKELKMWAEINGEMVCLGVIEKADAKLMALPFKDSASNYKITIDTKGNKDYASIDTEVASINLNKGE